MRKLIVTEFYSLDGLMSDPQDQMDWVTTTFSQDMGKYVEDVYANADTLFLGGVTYKIMANYWPTADTNPEAFQGDAEAAHIMNSIRKVVFSKNLKDLAWSNSALKTEIVPEEIKKMKQEPGKNMLVAGSASIVQQLTNFGLVDEYHLLVHPVILGTGKPLFKDMSERHNLKLISTEVFKNGVVLLRYEPPRE
jgi:dihydrofolate reductase